MFSITCKTQSLPHIYFPGNLKYFSTTLFLPLLPLPQESSFLFSDFSLSNQLVFSMIFRTESDLTGLDCEIQQQAQLVGKRPWWVWPSRQEPSIIQHLLSPSNLIILFLFQKNSNSNKLTKIFNKMVTKFGYLKHWKKNFSSLKKYLRKLRQTEPFSSVKHLLVLYIF